MYLDAQTLMVDDFKLLCSAAGGQILLLLVHNDADARNSDATMLGDLWQCVHAVALQ